MDLIQYLKTDDEMKNLRAKWKETFVTPFPPYNWDEYNGIEDYKEKIRNKLKNAPHQTDFYDKNCLMGSIIKCPNVKSDNKSKFITDT